MPEISTETLRKDPYAALRYAEFRSYVAMRFLLTFAYQIQAVVIGWHIYQLTKDPLSLGLIGLAEAIPAISVSLYGGYVADKSDKKKMMVWIIASMAFCSFILLLVTMPQTLVPVSKTLVVPIIYGMIL